MFAVTAAVLALLAPEPARAAPEPAWAVAGPVRRASFDFLGEAGGLEVEILVPENDPRYRYRRLPLYGAELYVEGKKATFAETVRWLSTAVRENAARSDVNRVVEVAVTIRPERYVQIGQADFRLVPRAKYYP